MDEAQGPEVVRETDIEGFERDGFVVVRAALPPERVDALRKAVERVEGVFETHTHTTGFRPLIDKHVEFLPLLEWPATFPLAVRLLRHYNLQCLTTHLVVVPPEPGEAGVGWHRDGGQPSPTAAGAQGRLSVKVGFFLEDAREPDSGALLVLPGSHRNDVELDYRAPRPASAVELELAAGDAVVLDNRLIHAAARNRTDRARRALYFAYGYRWLKPLDYDVSFPEALLGRCSAIGRQLLGERQSHVGYHYPTEADVPLKAWYRERFGETWIR